MRAILFLSLLILPTSFGCRGRKVEKINTESAPIVDRSSETRKGELVIDDSPQVLVIFQPPSPEYPPDLKRRGVEGDIRLVIHLTKDAQITKIEKEVGPEEFFSSAETYARACRFKVDPSAFYQRNTIQFRMTLKYRIRSLHQDRSTNN